MFSTNTTLASVVTCHILLLVLMFYQNITIIIIFDIDSMKP